MFAEPSVMCAHVLPYLLQIAEKCSQSSALAQRLNSWAEESAAQVFNSLTLCKQLLTGNTLECQTRSKNEFLEYLCDM